jgi:hypothetical protein
MLLEFKGIGAEFAANLWLEALFRHFDNRRQLASYAGLPWQLFWGAPALAGGAKTRRAAPLQRARAEPLEKGRVCGLKRMREGL